MIEPGNRLYLLILIIFAAITFVFKQELAIAEIAVIALLIIYSLLTARRRRKQLVEYIEDVTYNAESAKNNTQDLKLSLLPGRFLLSRIYRE